MGGIAETSVRAAARVRIGTFMNAVMPYGLEGGEVLPVGGVICRASGEQTWRLFAEIGAFCELF